jgi:Fe-S cluster biogenesis protein NfuA
MRMSDSFGSEDHVQKVLDLIRPAMQADGGDVQLVSVENETVAVRLAGMCLLCPSASMTLKHGIERTLRDNFPWIRNVVRVP